MDGFFIDTGIKIQKAAKIIFVVLSLITVIATFVYGIILLGDEDTVGFGLLVWLGGIVSVFINWFTYLLIYGFGIIVENAERKRVVDNYDLINHDDELPEI